MRYSDLIKLNRILGMLGSDHAGERAAGALAADRLVKSMDTSWWGLIGTDPEPRGSASQNAIVTPHELGVDHARAAESRTRQLRTENDLLRSGAPVVLAGDFNVAPTDLDIYPTKSWEKDALVQPQSRAAYRALVGRSWTDALRHRHPGERVYTFWHYMRQRWERDAGLRLDHLLLSPNLAPRLQEAGVDREVRGQPGASDHAPTWVRLADREYED
jgi:hypothetical protein